jgi:hypothetical protein
VFVTLHVHLFVDRCDHLTSLIVLLTHRYSICIGLVVISVLPILAVLKLHLSLHHLQVGTTDDGQKGVEPNNVSKREGDCPAEMVDGRNRRSTPTTQKTDTQIRVRDFGLGVHRRVTDRVANRVKESDPQTTVTLLDGQTGEIHMTHTQWHMQSDRQTNTTTVHTVTYINSDTHTHTHTHTHKYIYIYIYLYLHTHTREKQSAYR